MARTRRRFAGKFKSKVALEAIRGLRTISGIAQQFQVHPNQVTLWKKQLLGGASQVFEEGSVSSKSGTDEPQAAELFEQIGRLKVELEWLKKKWPRTREESLKWIDRDHESLSVRRQCQILCLHRSQLYYEPVPESEENRFLLPRAWPSSSPARRRHLLAAARRAVSEDSVLGLAEHERVPFEENRSARESQENAAFNGKNGSGRPGSRPSTGRRQPGHKV